MILFVITTRLTVRPPSPRKWKDVSSRGPMTIAFNETYAASQRTCRKGHVECTICSSRAFTVLPEPCSFSVLNKRYIRNTSAIRNCDY